MNGTSQQESSISPLEDAEEESSATLLASSKNATNFRLSSDADQLQHFHDTAATPLSDVRRSSGTAFADLKSKTLREEPDIKVYKRRWVVLGIFVIFNIVGTYQWSMYTIISNVIAEYYEVSNLSVDFTALVYLILYLVAFLPAGWILNNWGIRWAMIIGCLLHTLGCVLRMFSVPKDRFWVTMVGQCIVAVSQVFVPIIPARLAAVWFPAHQVSFACATGINGILVGNALGFFFPSLLVRNNKDKEEVAKDLSRTYIGLAVFSVLSLLLTVVFFREKPPLPPSKAQELLRTRGAGEESSENPKDFFASIKRLCKNRTFLALLFTASLISSVPIAMGTMLNQMLIEHFPGQEQEIGMVGVLLVVPGIASSAICGYILDRTHAFKLVSLFMFVLAFIGWAAFAILLRYENMIMMYIATAFLGFATGGSWVVGLEFVVEITYPEPEGTSGGLLSGVVQLIGIFATLLYGFMLTSWKEDIANTVAAVPLAAACVTLYFLKPELKRQAAQKAKSAHDIELDDVNKLS